MIPTSFAIQTQRDRVQNTWSSAQDRLHSYLLIYDIGYITLTFYYWLCFGIYEMCTNIYISGLF